jgi:hypothetical protein
MAFIRSTQCLVAASIAVAALASSQDRSEEPHKFLSTHIGYSAAELDELDAGKAVTRAIKTEEPREVAISGAVHIRATTDFFLRMYQDIERFDTAALAIKKISDPPRRDDFATMDIPDKELAALSTCKPNDCNMKFGQATMDLLASEIDWSQPDAAQRAEDLIRERGYVATMAYLENGSASLGAYRDQKQPAFVAGEFASLLDSSPYILEYRPELHDYLLNYPNAKLDGATDFIYWSQYDYGKPVLRISHATIYPTERGPNASAIITGKQIFFSHFFMAGLELHALVRDVNSESDAFYLVSLIRMRTDGVGGLFGNMLKKSVQNDVMANMQGYLDATKIAIERYYKDSASR